MNNKKNPNLDDDTLPKDKPYPPEENPELQPGVHNPKNPNVDDVPPSKR